MTDPLIEKHAILRNVALGVTYPPGWRAIVDKLATDLAQIHGVRIEQVKSKFGGLRVYLVHSGDNFGGWIDAEKMVDEAAKLSHQTCEDCGAPEAKTEACGGWLSTLCDGCRYTCEHERKLNNG